jgi:hypothetical protein
MSRYFNNYNQYLGSNRCCNLNSQGEQGPIGPTGASMVGPRGLTGWTGASYTGPTGRGCMGPTGPSVNSYWTPSGVNGIQYIGNVSIGGNLDVSGVITTTPTCGVRYNFSPIQTDTIINITASYLYQVVLCNGVTTINLPITGFVNGDWVIISNLSTTNNININNGVIVISIIPTFSTSTNSSIKFIFYSSGYTIDGNTFYWVISV